MKIIMLTSNYDDFHLLEEYCNFKSSELVFIEKYSDVITADSKGLADIVVVDYNGENNDIYQICEVLSNAISIPIVMLSKQEDFKSESNAFDVGCVDYVKTPYSIEVLLKRLETHIKISKTQPMNKKVVILSPEYRIDLENKLVFDNDIEVKLTVKQYEITKCLVLNPNKILTREQLIKEIWGSKKDDNVRVVDTHIKNIRKLLPNLKIETVNGGGYRYRD